MRRGLSLARALALPSAREDTADTRFTSALLPPALRNIKNVFIEV